MIIEAAVEIRILVDTEHFHDPGDDTHNILQTIVPVNVRVHPQCTISRHDYTRVSTVGGQVWLLGEMQAPHS